MIYAVIDTNVFVSAFITQNPNSATTKIVEALAHGKITPLYDEVILAEYKEVLSRAHFHINPSLVESLFGFLDKNGMSMQKAQYDGLFRDESDRVFYEVMLSKDDSFLVTGNLKHFPVTPRVVTPAQMLQILNEE